MDMITNPILPGFNPDPSILRVGEDYYIATSTFEWFPGVQIHHSRDFVNWELLPHPLTRVSQLDMEGNINSGGIWAPCLSYDNGVFYLIYTDVKSRAGAFKDTHNYLVTATDIRGPWSEPVYLNSSGFDPSLFHDDDGRKWLLNMVWDFRKGRNKFGGIYLQEYDVEKQALVGPVTNIFKGTELGLTEAPHLYKRNGYYYLITAEGGTRYDHAVTMARSKSITGPYEVDPENPILTSAGRPDLELQKAGHASLVETHSGDWYLAFLCGRPTYERYCTLGRETALVPCYWNEEGWLRIEGGGNHPSVQVRRPSFSSELASGDAAAADSELASGAVANSDAAAADSESASGAVANSDAANNPLIINTSAGNKVMIKDDFDEPELQRYWNSLRIPADESWLSLTERPGHLRLKGMESLSSTHRQALLARRQQSFHFEAETKMEFDPDTFQQMAGLILYYDTEDYAYLRVTLLDSGEKGLGIIQSIGGQYDELLDADIVLPAEGPYYLKAVVHRELLQFYYSLDGEQWQAIGGEINVSHLSDDYADLVRFTGTFIGVCVQDLSGRRKHADFDYFIYKHLDE